MANNEAKVRFRAETSEFQSSIKELNSAMSTLRTEAKLNEAEFKSTGNATAYLENKQKILDSQLAATKGKQEALDAELRIAKSLFGEDSEQVAKLERQLNTAKAQEANLQSALSACNSELRASKTETASLTESISQQESRVERLKAAYKEEVIAQREGSDEAKRLASKIKEESEALAENKAKLDAAERAADALTAEEEELGRATADMAKYATLSDIALGDLAARGFTALVSKAKDSAKAIVETGKAYEASMSKVAALSGATGDEYDQLAAKAREMGATTTFSASESADALGYMALAGWDTQSMLVGLPGVLSLAQAGEMDLAAASDLVTDYLSAFNMTADETSRMVDVLAYAQANANTNTEQLGGAFRNCAANCNAAGMDVETTSAAIAMMSNQGLKGEKAGTALNAVMRDMTAQMKDGRIAVGDQTVAVMDAEGNYRDFAAILADVEAATNGMGDAERSSALQATFTADSIKGLNLLLNAGSSELSGFRDSLYGCEGAAQKTAETMTNNLGGDLAGFNSALEETELQLYDKLQEPLRMIVQLGTNELLPMIQSGIQNLDRIVPILAAVGSAIAAQVAYQKILKPQMVSLNMVTKEATAAEVARAAATNAGTVATKAASAALKTLGNAMPLVVMTALVSVIAMAVDAINDARKHEEKMTQSTKGLEAAASGLTVRLEDEAGALAGVGDAAASVDMDQLIQDHIDLANSISESAQKAQASISMLDGYGSSIGSLAGRADLTESQIAELKLAVDGANEAMGTSWTVAQDTDGAWRVVADGAAVATDAIDTLIEKQKAQLRLEASRESYKNLYEQQAKDAEAYATKLAEVESAQDAFNAKLESLGENRYLTTSAGLVDLADAEATALAAAKEGLADIEGQSGATQSALNKLDEQMKLCAMGTSESAEAFITAASSNIQYQAAVQAAGYDLVDFTGKLSETGISVEQFNDLNQSELAELVSGYDGSVGSITASLYALATDSSTYGQQAGQWLNEGFSQGAQSVVNSATSMTGMTTGQFMLLAQSAGAQGEEAVTALANSLINGASRGGDAAAQMMAAVALSMTNGDVEAASRIAGGDAVQGLVNGLTDGQGLPAEAAGQMGEDLLNQVRATLGIASPSTEMIAIGGFLNEGLAQGISESVGAPEGAMGQVGQRLAESLQQGMQSAQGGVASAAEALSKLSADHMSSHSTDAWWAGHNMAEDSYTSGLASGQPRVASAADSLSKLSADHMSSHSLDAWWAGYNMGEGMANGIREGASLAVNAARDMARDAVNAAKKEAEINSPSKVMAREVGVGYPEGLAEGIEVASAVSDEAARTAARSAVKASFDGLSEGLDGAGRLFAVPNPGTLRAFAPSASLSSVEVALSSGTGPAAGTEAIERGLGSILRAIESLDDTLPRKIRSGIPTTGTRSLSGMFG